MTMIFHLNIINIFHIDRHMMTYVKITLLIRKNTITKYKRELLYFNSISILIQHLFSHNKRVICGTQISPIFTVEFRNQCFWCDK